MLRVAGSFLGELTVNVFLLASLVRRQLCAFLETQTPFHDLCGGTTGEDIIGAFGRATYDEPSFMFLTLLLPLGDSDIWTFLSKLQDTSVLKRFVVDEAHCRSHLGPHFKSEYQRAECLKERFPRILIMTLLGTIPGDAKDEILSVLQITKCPIFQTSFNHPHFTRAILDKQPGSLAYEQIKAFIL
jgi:hypothetical protein